MYTKEQFDDAASQWLVKYRATEDPGTLSQILTRTRENLDRLGGYPAPSAFERSYLELVSEKVIAPFRGSLLEKPIAAPEIGQTQVTLSVEEYRKLPAAVAAQNYRTDRPKGFRAAVDTLIAQGNI